MNYSDNDLQHQVEHGHTPGNSADAKAYKFVFQALEKEPYALPDNFSDGVLQRLKPEKVSSLQDYAWLAPGLLIFLVATIVTVNVAGVSIDFSPFQFFISYSGFFAFGLVFVVAIQYLDRILVTRRMDF